jgi:hypothetical protein
MKVIGEPDNDMVRETVKVEVRQICSRFPVPGIDD